MELTLWRTLGLTVKRSSGAMNDLYDCIYNFETSNSSFECIIVVSSL